MSTEEETKATAPVEGEKDSKKKEEEEEEKKIEKAVKDKKDSAILTRQLQKLTLEHQKTVAKDRLKVIQADHNSHLSSAKTFDELNLPKNLLEAIYAMGFDRPSAIQEAALPRILADPPRNLIGQAQSGSGKTAAFTIGMLYRVVVDSPPTTQALCVTPTRELAIQIVEKAVEPMSQNMSGIKIQLAIAGTDLKQVNAHVVVGTPGKIVDWLKRKSLIPKNIKVFVLDEGAWVLECFGIYFLGDPNAHFIFHSFITQPITWWKREATEQNRSKSRNSCRRPVSRFSSRPLSQKKLSNSLRRWSKNPIRF